MQNAHDIDYAVDDPKEQHVRPDRIPSVPWTDIIARSGFPGIGGDCFNGLL
jgi:hypothetical protein